MKETNLEMFSTVIATDRTGINPAGFNSGDDTQSKFKASKNVIKETIRNKHACIYASFGKDSSCVVYLALMAMRELEQEGIQYKRVFFLTSNTLIESPLMDRYVRNEIAKFNTYVSNHKLNAEHRLVTPSLNENHLFNAISGRSVFSTASMSNTCAVDMKVTPMDREKAKIGKAMGFSAAEAREQFVGILGTRFDESLERENNMHSRGEKAHEINKQFDKANPKKWGYMLSPVAYWGVMDVFSFLSVAGKVSSEESTTGVSALAERYKESHPFASFTDYRDMLEIYRDSNSGGTCGLLEGGSDTKSQGCGARHGCVLCQKSGMTDKSMEALLEHEEHQWMQPLNHYRNLIAAYSFDPSKRNYLARSVCEDGYITVSPNAYSPEFCSDLLKWMLTIQVNELEWAEANNTGPRFEYIDEQMVVAIDFRWARYGYHAPFEASRIWNDVMYNGARYPMPDLPSVIYPRLPVFKAVQAPFQDNEFHGLGNGAFDMTAATAGYSAFQIKDVDERFTVDKEGAGLFMDFESVNAIRTYQNSCPSAVVRYFMRLGTVSMKKGAEARLDQGLRIAQQIHRHGLRTHLDNPVKLIEILQTNAGKSIRVSKGDQMDLLGVA